LLFKIELQEDFFPLESLINKSALSLYLTARKPMSGLKELALSSVNKDTTKFEVIKKCHHEKKIIYYWNAETFKSKLRNDTHCCTTEKNDMYRLFVLATN
jgi:hypothetical protein